MCTWAGPDRRPHRLDDVAVIGVDEYAWRRHTHKGDKFVTMIIDLTPVLGRPGCWT